MRGLRLLFVVGLATGFMAEKFFVSSQSSFPTADDLYLEGKTSGEFPLDDEDGDDDGSGSGSGDYALTDLMNQHVDRTTLSNKMVPDPSQSATVSPHITATTAADIQHPPTTAEDMFPDANSKNEEAGSIEPTADNWITHRTSLSSTTSHPTEITTLNRVVSVTKETNEDNSLDRWDVPTTKTSGDEAVIKEIDNNEILAEDGRGSRLHELSPEEVTSENLWERTEVLAAVIACGVVGFLCAVFLLLLLAYRMKKKDEGSYDLGDTKLSNTQYQKAPTKEFYA